MLCQDHIYQIINYEANSLEPDRADLIVLMPEQMAKYIKRFFPYFSPAQLIFFMLGDE